MRKTQEELDQLSPAELKAYNLQQKKIVFGEDFKVKNGKPVEQGIGSPGRETENHYAAIRKWEGVEAEKAARAAARPATAKPRRKAQAAATA